MKSLFTVLLLTIAYMATAQTTPTGPGTRQQLESFDWFAKQYEGYKVSKKGIKELKAVDKVTDYRIVIVMGTWCGDSHQQVPRFYKVLDELGFPQDKVLLVLVDEQKNDPSGLGKQFKIKYVPTFIFLDDNSKELGRIVETPDKSLEADWLKVIAK